MRPCAGPAEYLGAGNWEVVAGRIGDALIRCGAEKAALAAHLAEINAALGGK